MEITSGQMAQKRLHQLVKGVSAAAKAIDDKFRDVYGEPLFEKTKRVGQRPRYHRASPYRVAMITLTYRQDGMWAADQLPTLLDHYRKWFKRNAKHCAIPECHYVWVMEMTAIGRPHYHIVMWMPKGIKPPMPDKQGWWPHGSTQAIFAHSPVGYLAKYASKQESKSGRHMPKGARLWGYGGLKMVERGPVAYALAPRWVKKFAHHDSHPVKRVYERTERVLRRVIGVWEDWQEKVIRKSGWFLTRGESRGYWLFSPYEFEGFTGSGVLLRSSGVVEVLTPEGDSFFNHVGV
ncbi:MULTISPECIES: adhesin [unclassified Pseudoxanthomonas]|uniref:rolling circle replication-associated protein n=1 Tax=unclassified Pseudoxanthomonas TaxID=2645906 RepID=UPI00307ED482